LERSDAEPQRESTATAVKIVLADYVLACVQELVQSVQLNAVTVLCRNDLRRAVHGHDERLMRQETVLNVLHVQHHAHYVWRHITTACGFITTFKRYNERRWQ